MYFQKIKNKCIIEKVFVKNWSKMSVLQFFVKETLNFTRFVPPKYEKMKYLKILKLDFNKY